jgi:ABC-type transport system substrate-binding protein
VNDPQLSALADKQLTQLNLSERKQTLKGLEDIMADQMYRIPLSSYTYNYFADPSVKNIQIPRDAYNGSIGYIRYWWFG